MDRITRYRALLETLFYDYQRLYNLEPTPGVEAHCIFDEARDHYLLLDLGWKGEKRVKRTILYVRLIDGKFSIEED